MTWYWAVWGFFYGYLSFLYERVVSEAAWQLRHFTHTSKFLFLLSVSRQQTGIWWAWVMSKYMRDRSEAQKPVRAARQKPSSSAFILGGAVLTFRSSPWARISSPGPHLQPAQIGTQGPGFLWHPFQKLQFGCDVEFLWPVCCFGSGGWILYWD